MSLQNKLICYYKPNDANFYSYGFGDTERQLITSNVVYNPTYDAITANIDGQIQLPINETYKSFTFSIGLVSLDVYTETIFSIPSVGLYCRLASTHFNYNTNYLSIYINGVEYKTNTNGTDIVAFDPTKKTYITLVVDSFGFIKIYNNKTLASTGFDSNLASSKNISTIYINKDNPTNTFTSGTYSDIGFWGRPLLNGEISYLIDAVKDLVPFIPIDANLEGNYSLSNLNDNSGKNRHLIGYLADDYNPVYNTGYNNPGGIISSDRDIETKMEAFYSFDSTNEAFDYINVLNSQLAIAGGVGVSPTYETGKINDCVVYYGYGHHYRPAFNFKKNFSISFWINSDLSIDTVILGQTENFSIIILTDGSIKFESSKSDAYYPNILQQSATTVNSGLISPNQWHHICLSVSDGNGSLYVDNLLVNINNVSDFKKFKFELTNTNNIGPSHYFIIGGGRFFVGCDSAGTNYSVSAGSKKLDALIIWSRALSHNEVAYLYNSSSGIEWIGLNYPPYDITSNLIAYYDFETNLDSSKNGYDLITQGGSVEFNQGKLGKGLKVNSKNDFVYTTPSPINNLNSITVSFWLKVDAINNSFTILIGDMSNPPISIYSYFDILFFDLWDDYHYISTYALIYPDSQWRNYTVVYDGVSIKSYVDGIFIFSDQSTSEFILNQSNSFKILHSEDWNNFLNGSLDEVGIWSRVLSQSEIEYIYNNGNGKYISKYIKDKSLYIKDKSLYYDAGNLTLKDDISYNINRNNRFSFSFWIKANSLRNMTIIGGDIPDISRFNISMDSSGGLILDDLISNQFTIPNVFTLDLCFIVVTYVDNNLKIYKDGVLLNTLNYDASNFIIKNLSVGSLMQNQRSSSINYFDGILDNVMIWSRYLTLDEVVLLYEGYNIEKTNVNLNDSLVGLYKFNDVPPENFYYDLIEPFTDTLIIKDSSPRRKHLKFNRFLPAPPWNSLVYIPTNGGVGVALTNGRSQLKNDNFNFITNETGEITVSIYVGYYYNSNIPINILNLFGNLISIKKDVTPSGGGYSWSYLIYCNGIFVHRISTPFINYFKHHIVVKLNRLTRTAIISHNNNKVYINSLPLFTITNDEFILGDINYGNGIYIDAVGVWNRGLNDLEIKTLYNKGYQFENFGVDETDPSDDGYGYGYVTPTNAFNAKFKSNTQIKNNIKII